MKKVLRCLELIQLLPTAESKALSISQMSENQKYVSLYCRTGSKTKDTVKKAIQRDLETLRSGIEQICPADLIKRTEEIPHRFWKGTTEVHSVANVSSTDNHPAASSNTQTIYTTSVAQIVQNLLFNTASNDSYNKTANPLTESELSNRIMYYGTGRFVPNPELVERQEKIQSIIKKRKCISFSYRKSGGKVLEFTSLEPIGVFVNHGEARMVVNPSEKLPKEKNGFDISKMLFIKEYDNPTPITQNRAISLLSCYDRYLTSEPVYCELIVKKNAARIFANNTLAGATDYKFKWLDEDNRIGKVTFFTRIGVSLLNEIRKHGSYVEVIGSQILKEQLKLEQPGSNVIEIPKSHKPLRKAS